MTSSVLDRLNVHVVGDGATTVVMAHGFGTDQTAWRHQVAALAPRFRVVLFDHLGCGDTDLASYDPRRYGSLDDYAQDVVRLLEAMRLRGAVFVGHSASGMIGLLVSVARPDLLARLVMVGASPRYLDDVGYVGGFKRSDLDALYEAMARNYLEWANGFAPLVMANAERPGLGAEFARSLGAMRPDIAQSVARAIFETDCRPLLPRVSIPVLVVQMRHDVAVPAEVGEYLARNIPRSRLVLLQAEGHLPHLSAPSQLTEVLLEELTHAA